MIVSEAIDTNEPGAEARILADSAIQAELSRQRRDLEELLTATEQASPTRAIERLRERAQRDAVRFFRLDWQSHGLFVGEVATPARVPQRVPLNDRATEAIVQHEPLHDLEPLTDGAWIHFEKTLDDGSARQQSGESPN